jgi:nucleoside-diphosphate-sugar epimerase
MTSSLVLVTGANGHIGFRTLVYALQAGYRVRAAVRTQSKADTILSAPSIQAISPADRLTFVLVPDLLVPGAYDDAVRDADYIIHVASSLSRGLDDPERYEEDLIQPAVRGTFGILESAASVDTVKRVVITSSMATLWPPGDTDTSSDYVADETSRVSYDPVGPFKNPLEAYEASKIRALNATERFVQNHNHNHLSFDVVNIHPSIVLGKNELVTDRKDILQGSNFWPFAQVLGLSQEAPLLGHTVHLDDVADIHVRALNMHLELEPGRKTQSLIATSGGIDGTDLSEAVAVVNRHFPEEVKSGVLPNNGTVRTRRKKLDASATERRLGLEFRSYEDQIVSVTRHYLELVNASS